MMPGLEDSLSHDTSPPPMSALMSDRDYALSEQVKRFVFRSRKTQDCAQSDEESLEILIPEVSGDDDDFARPTGTCELSVFFFLGSPIRERRRYMRHLA